MNETIPKDSQTDSLSGLPLQSNNAPTPVNAPVPETKSADGSAVLLKGAGQLYIVLGWVFCVFIVLFGILLSHREYTPAPAIIGLLIGLLFLYWGYSNGAKKKAIAKAAIEASKAAERSARIEQMMVNMVRQDLSPAGALAQATQNSAVANAQVAKTVCPKCGAQVSNSSKFCPGCGASMSKTCPKCGTSIPVKTKFCPECGEKQA